MTNTDRQSFFASLKLHPQLISFLTKLEQKHPNAAEALWKLYQTHPILDSCMKEIVQTLQILVECFEKGHRLYICGNGGSFADAIHIAGELLKSFECKRPLSPEDRQQFTELRFGEELATALEYGFPAITLGLNHSLTTALENDNPTRYLTFAQELFVLGQPQDVLLAISTSGNAQNVVYAVATAKAKGLITIGLTGENGGLLAQMADVAIKVPAKITSSIQELHLPVYHALCRMLEAYFYSAK